MSRPGAGGARAQVTRLLALAPYLQAREGVRLAEVAEDFGVTPAQVVKDLKVLWMCGLPGLGPGDMIDIDFESFEDDPDGLVRIANAEFLARPLRLGGAEAAALLVALRALREGSPDDARAVVDRVLAKIEAAAGDAATPTVQVVATGAPAQAAVREAAATLSSAVRADRQVRLGYYVPTRDESTTRVVDPLEVLTSGGHAYLDAWCHLARGRRLFRLDRVLDVEVLDRLREDHPAEEVAARDLADGLFRAGPDDLGARVRLAPHLAWVTDFYPVTSVEECDDGSLEVTLSVGDPQWLVRLALGLAPGLEVLAPGWLARRTTQVAQQALSLYAVPEPSGA